MIYKGIKYMVMFALLCIFSCTTEVDICMDNSHMHLAEVELSYDLTNIPEEEQATLPDSMIVVAYRMVRSWKCSYVAPVAEDAGYGRYIYNRPYQNLADVESKTAQVRSTELPETAVAGEPLYVKRGEYRFITFNNTLTDGMFENKANSNWFDNDIIDEIIAEKDIELYYKSHNLKSELLEKYGKSWIDFNQYTTYIARSNAPVYFQFSERYELDDTKKNNVTLGFEKKTQDFEIRFSIARQQVVVEKVVAEISGIPSGMNLVTGKLDFSKTYKTLFEVHDTEQSSEMSGVSKFVGNISVMGLVSSNSKELDTGPGIMQLAIYTYAFNERGEKRSKIFHVGINMYNTMRKYGYVLAGHKEKIVLEIEQELNIRKDEVINAEETDSSLDYWIIRDDIHVDI